MKQPWIPGEHWAWCRILTAGLLASFSACLPAQSDDIVGHFRVFSIGAVQRPVGLDIDGVSSRHRGRHLFLGVAYQRPVSDTYRIGAGAGLSWGTYGVELKGQYSDSTGTYLASDEQWSRMVWYPFERGFTGPRAWRTDPFQLWGEVVRVFHRTGKGSWWELSAVCGAASPLGAVLTISAASPPLQPGDMEPVQAWSTLGDQWHVMLGFGVDRIVRLKNNDRLLLGLDWRSSLGRYFEQGVVVFPMTNSAAYMQRQTSFMWFGIRAGYDFTWGGGRKPGWTREMEDRGLPPQLPHRQIGLPVPPSYQ